MKNYIIAFVSVLAYKFISNIIYYFKILHFRQLYYDYLNRKSNNISIYKRTIINLFKKAGIKDAFIPMAQPMGYGQIANFKSSIFTNFPNLLQPHVSGTLSMFDEAIGIYKSRIFEAFSPLYWIDCIIFLPRNIFQYIGFDSEKMFIKIFQIIWWIFAPVGVIFRTSLLNFVKHILLSTH